MQTHSSQSYLVHIYDKKLPEAIYFFVIGLESKGAAKMSDFIVIAFLSLAAVAPLAYLGVMATAVKRNDNRVPVASGVKKDLVFRTR